ncbi:MAG TPA: hypothetical protein VFV38_28470 [Ktedonobacteraceae bacterium]|nr:hypothetical protein [Ktedonobacteraceae bacterium]
MIVLFFSLEQPLAGFSPPLHPIIGGTSYGSDDASGGFDLSSRGTALLCSADQNNSSYFFKDHSGTMFTEALVAALTRGNGRWRRTYYSLPELRDTIKGFLERLVEEKEQETRVEENRPPRPVLHYPDPGDGNLDRVRFFPNVAAKELVTPPPVDPVGSVSISPADFYRDLVKDNWVDGKLDETKRARLTERAEKYRLPQEQVAAIEREEMGDTKEAIWSSRWLVSIKSNIRKESERLGPTSN